MTLRVTYQSGKVRTYYNVRALWIDGQTVVIDYPDCAFALPFYIARIEGI